ncbi:MAG TPA: peroxidase-related enzyme [Candidatus Acidoferrum sp.]|nr:peroxidase-related enzyme [Candidatus Acidoferrum sp.]
MKSPNEIPPVSPAKCFALFQEAFGFVPNLLSSQSRVPRIAEAHAALEAAVRLRSGSISRLQKERILLCIAVERGDAYCANMDAKILLSLGAPQSSVDDLLSRRSQTDLTLADAASLQFCLKLAHDSVSFGTDDVDALRSAGFDDASILEAVFLTGVAVYRCTLSAGLALEPEFGHPSVVARGIASPGEASRRRLPPHSHGISRSKPYVSAPYLSPKAFEPFAILRKSHGFMPNFFRAQSLRVDLLQAELEAVERILQPEDILSRVQKECILLAVSAVNLNSYCVAMHCNLLRGMGMTPEEGDQIALDYHESSLSQADQALLDFAVKLGTRAYQVTRKDVAGLRALGFAEEQVLECMAVTALNNFSNTVQMGLGIELDFEAPPPYEENKLHLSAAVHRHSGETGVPNTLGSANDPDTSLVASSQAGSLEAFEGLVRRHSQLIYRALVAILGNAADAEDAMQDAFLSAFKNIGGFQGRSKFSTWLVSIARNTALQRLRSKKIIESLDETEDFGDSDLRPRQLRAWEDNPEQGHSKTEIRQLVEKGILSLPAKYRVVVMLRDIEQLSTDEVARQLALSVPAVKVRLLRGRLMLRDWLSPHFAVKAGRIAP